MRRFLGNVSDRISRSDENMAADNSGNINPSNELQVGSIVRKDLFNII